MIKFKIIEDNPILIGETKEGKKKLIFTPFGFLLAIGIIFLISLLLILYFGKEYEKTLLERIEQAKTYEEQQK